MIAEADRWLTVDRERDPAETRLPKLGCTMTVCEANLILRRFGHLTVRV
jgi:hypothetical protein